MDAVVTNTVVEILPHFDGFVYPNEAGEQPLWGVLIVLYPYITGLVAGAFIMASLVRVFRVKALEPVYRLSLLTALAFLLCAPLPLLFHLGRPERCFQIMITPHFSSPMAMFGFVYAWYLMAVLLLELWFDYRKDSSSVR
jgi:Ni/Fe-hydrogenase subunit HybB-like protein